MSEIELVKKITKDTPILLLDDVLSELDSNRQNYLLNSIGDIQTIITFIIVGVCGVLCVIMLTYGFIKNYKIRCERFKRFGYKTTSYR